MNMKSTLRGLGIAAVSIVFVLLVANNWYVDLVEPYNWDKNVRKEVAAQGFELLTERKGGALIFPWTIFKPYTQYLTFVNPNSKKNFRGFIAAETISSYRDDRGRVETWRGIHLFDCKSKIFSTLADEKGEYSGRLFRADGGPMKKWWTEMNEDMLSYFCK